jgi:outer membrane protein assembly factor BamB
MNFKFKGLNTVILSALCMFSAPPNPLLGAKRCGRDVLDGEWPALGQNYANAQVNEKEKKIGIHNVSSLIAAWDFKLSGPGVLSQPVFAAEKVYFADSLGTIHALNAETGSKVWSTTIPNGSFVTTPTLTKDRIYIASGSASETSENSFAIALDRNTGNILWQTPLFLPGQFASEFPGNGTVVGDLFIVPVSSSLFDPKAQGRVMAFDRNTGDLVWTVAMTSDQFQPNPEFGPGVGVFSSGAVDIKRNLYFIGTGQTFSGNESPLADSIIAIDYCTGERVWSYKFEVNDVWQPSGPTVTRPLGTFDHDVAVPPNLFTVKIGGKEVDCVGVGSKGGQYKIFARDQKDPCAVRPLAVLNLDPGSSIGTIQSTPVVHDGVLYIASVAVPENGHRISNDNVYIPGVSPVEDLTTLFEKASMKTMALDLQKLLKSGFVDGTIPPAAIIWTDFSEGVQGKNPITFANGMIYQTSQTGYLRVLNAKTGVELFKTTVEGSTPPTIIAAGATIAHGHVYMAYGYDPLGVGRTEGGVKAYKPTK